MSEPMSFYPYFEVLLLISSTAIFVAGFHPSRTSALSYGERTRGVRGIIEHSTVQQLVVILLSMPLPLIAVIESALIISQQFGTTSHKHLGTQLLSEYIFTPSPYLSPVRILGALMMLTGGLIRLSCFRTLGKFFSIHVGIQKDHKLITVFPYNIVRHPSYGALFLSQPGCILAYFTPGSWIQESGVLHTWTGGILFGLYAYFMIHLVLAVYGRVPQEDGILKSHFGEEWEAWAKDVRYLMIPGIY